MSYKNEEKTLNSLFDWRLLRMESSFLNLWVLNQGQLQRTLTLRSSYFCAIFYLFEISFYVLFLIEYDFSLYDFVAIFPLYLWYRCDGIEKYTVNVLISDNIMVESNRREKLFKVPANCQIMLPILSVFRTHVWYWIVYGSC